MSSENTLGDTPENLAEQGGGFVVKSVIDGLLSGGSEVGLNGEFIWPISQHSLALLYRAMPEHQRAVHIKAEGAFGNGIEGGGADQLDSLADTGFTELAVSLGMDLEACGNAFLQKIRNSAGALVGLRRLPWITMHRYRAGFLQRVPLANGTTRKITFTADEIIHLREPCPMGRRYAFPSWIGGEGMMELAHAATRYNASFFKNSAIPEYAVIFEGGTPSEAHKKAIQSFFRRELMGVDNAHRTLVLNVPEGGSVKFEKLTADIKDADFLKLLDAARDRMPIAHGVPPRMLGIMSAGQLGGGGEVAGQLFTFEKLTLQPKRRRMLDQLRPLLGELGLKPVKPGETPGDGEVGFAGIDMTPPKDDAENVPALVQAGIISPEEARAILSLTDTAADGQGTPVARAAPRDPIDALAALLAKL